MNKTRKDVGASGGYEDGPQREVEAGLVARIRKFLLELGVGFAFVGRQLPIKVPGTEYRIDSLFIT